MLKMLVLFAGRYGQRGNCDENCGLSCLTLNYFGSKSQLYIYMAGLRVQRVIVTCPDTESYIYLVIGDHVSRAQNVTKSQIFQELLNVQIQLKSKQSVELQIWKYFPQKRLLKCSLTQSHLQFDGLRPLHRDHQWQVYVDCKKISFNKPIASIKSTTSDKSPKKKKVKSSQKNLKKDLQKQINMLTGEKPHSLKKPQNWKKSLNYHSLTNKSIKNNDSTRSGNTTGLKVGTEASIEYGLQESMGKTHRTLIYGKN